MPTDLQTNDQKGELRQWTVAHYNLKRREAWSDHNAPVCASVWEQLQRGLRIYSLHVAQCTECACVCVCEPAVCEMVKT